VGGGAGRGGGGVGGGGCVGVVGVTGVAQGGAGGAGQDGWVSNQKAGLIIVECSTSEPHATTQLRELAHSKGVVFVDAPLARSPVEAEAGRLNIMVGATQATFAKIEPVLKCCAENVFHVGEPGAGHAIKLPNNFIGQAIGAATAEAVAVGKSAGIDLKQLVSLISAGPVNSGVFQAVR